MRKTIFIIIAIAVVLVGFIFALNMNIIPKNQNGPYDNFIICLKASGIKFYGDYTKLESLRQMSLFDDSLSTLENSGVYIECNKYGPNPKVNKCQEANVKMYPSWEIKEIKYEGILGLNRLEELSGCKREN